MFAAASWLESVDMRKNAETNASSARFFLSMQSTGVLMSGVTSCERKITLRSSTNVLKPTKDSCSFVPIRR